MSGKTLKAFCRIYPWIEIQDAEFATAIRDLCMEGALSAGRGGRGAGVTFLFPTAEVRKQIVKDAYSSADYAEKAVSKIKSLILFGAVTTPAEFRKEVSSRLGILVEVESVSGSTVTLKGGAKLKKSASFVPIREDSGLAVWEVESGDVPMTGPAARPHKESRNPDEGEKKTKKTKKGGGDGDDLPNFKRRGYFDEMMRNVDPPRWLGWLVSLLNFLRKTHPDIFARVLAILDRNFVVSLILILEPFKQQGPYIVPDEALFGPRGWNMVRMVVSPLAEFNAFFEEKIEGAGATDVRAYRNQVDELRMTLIGDGGRNANKLATPAAVLEIYKKADTTGVGQMERVFPAGSSGMPGYHAWRDAFRFYVGSAINAVFMEPSFNADEMRALLCDIRDMWPGNDYKAENFFMNVEAIQSNVSPRAEHALLLRFINSTDFLYLPVNKESILKGWLGLPVLSAGTYTFDPTDLNIFNSELAKAKMLEHVESMWPSVARTEMTEPLANSASRAYYAEKTMA